MGKAVVTASIGARGIDVTHGVIFLLQIVLQRLLIVFRYYWRMKSRKRIGHRAREFVEQRHVQACEPKRWITFFKAVRYQ